MICTKDSYNHILHFLILNRFYMYITELKVGKKFFVNIKALIDRREENATLVLKLCESVNLTNLNMRLKFDLNMP